MQSNVQRKAKFGTLQNTGKRWWSCHIDGLSVFCSLFSSRSMYKMRKSTCGKEDAANEVLPLFSLRHSLFLFGPSFPPRKSSVMWCKKGIPDKPLSPSDPKNMETKSGDKRRGTLLKVSFNFLAEFPSTRRRQGEGRHRR